MLQEILAGNLEGGVSAKSEEICVMFTDIRGFTGISETLPPEQVTNLLTALFRPHGRLRAPQPRHHGQVHGRRQMMVLFGAPKKRAIRV